MDNDVESARQSLIDLVRGGHTPAEAAAKLGDCPSWANKWWGGFNDAGWDGLKSQSRAPHHHLKRTSEKTERKILEIRVELEKEAHRIERSDHPGLQCQLVSGMGTAQARRLRNTVYPHTPSQALHQRPGT